MLSGERKNPPNPLNVLDQYIDLRTNELNAQRDYWQTEEGEEMMKEIAINAGLTFFPYGRAGSLAWKLTPKPIRKGITTLAKTAQDVLQQQHQLRMAHAYQAPLMGRVPRNVPHPALGGIQSLKTNVKDVMGESLRKSQPDIDEMMAMRGRANQFLPKPKNLPHPDIVPGVSGASVKEIFVNKPSYHGTKDPIMFERHGTKTNELGIEVPARGQSKKSPSFSVSSDYHLAKEFTENPLYSMNKDKAYATQKWNPRVIPTVLDKKYSNKILDYRDPKHRDFIAKEYKMEREKMKKELFKKDGTLRNDRVLAEKEAAFDKATLDNIKKLDNWEKTNWEVMETIQPKIKERGWMGYTTVEKGVINLQVLDGRMIRGVRDKDTGQIMYNTSKPLKELEDGGPVREGIMTLPKPINLRKKQVTVHKPSKSLKKQGFNKETRLKAQYKNVSYIG